MKSALKMTFAAFILAGSLATGAMAQPGVVKTHPCASEHQAVVAACKQGDPCSADCKSAHKAMKACRVSNNLPVKEHTGGHKGKGCKKPVVSAPAAPTAAQ